MEGLFWLVGGLVGICLLALGWRSFEKKFGEGSFKFVLYGLGLIGLGLTLIILFEATEAETICYASHKKNAFVQVTRNCFHQVTNTIKIPLDSISEISVDEDVSYSRGHRKVNYKLALTADGQKIYPLRDKLPVNEQYKELHDFLVDPNAPDYLLEEDARGSILLFGGPFCLVGLFFLKKAFFDGGEFGDMKRKLLRMLKSHSAKTEEDKYKIIGTLFLFTAGTLIDKLFSGDKLPLASIRGQAARFGGGFVGMGKLSGKEVQLVLAESSIFLYYWFEQRAKINDNLNLLESAVFQRVVLTRFLDRQPDIVELAEQRLDTYRDSAKGAKALGNADSWFVDYLNYVMLNKKLKRDDSGPNAAFRGTADISSLQNSNFYVVYSKCIDALLKEDISQLSAYETAAILSQAIKQTKLNGTETEFSSFSTDVDMVEDLEIAAGQSSIQRALSKRR